jgi:hypothetical protein
VHPGQEFSQRFSLSGSIHGAGLDRVIVLHTSLIYQSLWCSFSGGIKPISIEVESQGIEYFDVTNDFGLTFPEGPIPEGESLQLDVGMTLFGPFKFPEGLRPVLVCVRGRNKIEFLKPVTVTIPHFLNLVERKDDLQSLGLKRSTIRTLRIYMNSI